MLIVPCLSVIEMLVMNLEATEEKTLTFCTFHILDSLGDSLWHGNWNTISGFLWRQKKIVSLFRGKSVKKIFTETSFC